MTYRPIRFFREGTPQASALAFIMLSAVNHNAFAEEPQNTAPKEPAAKVIATPSEAEKAKDSAAAPEVPTKAGAALSAVESDKKKADSASGPAQKEGDAKSSHAACGGASWCLYGGALLASYSLTLGLGNRSGQTGHHIVSLFVPTAGVRWAAHQYLSVDLGVYTSIISPEFKVNEISRAGTGCSTKGGAFEDALPCEGNALLRPYGALLLGGTVGTGSSSLGILTLGLTTGLARTAQDATAVRFVGIVIGSGGVFATAPLSKGTL